MNIKKILSRVMTVLTVVSFLFGLVIFISVLRANQGEVPSVLGYSVLRLQTGSMEPEYKTGSIIITKKVDVNDLEKGDVISFYSTSLDISDRVNTHRVVDIIYDQSGNREFVTKGDANELQDETPVLSSRVIGKVIFDLGVVSGSVLGMLQNPKVIFFLIIVPLIIITFTEAVNLVNIIMNKDGDPEEENSDESGRKNKNKNSD